MYNVVGEEWFIKKCLCNNEDFNFVCVFEEGIRMPCATPHAFSLFSNA